MAIQRPDLLLWLDRVVGDHLMTAAQASKAVDDFDAGLLPLDSVPLDLSDGIQGLDDILLNDSLDLTR